MARRKKYSDDHEQWLRRAPRLPAMTAEEFDELFSDLEPATDDDVPWTFPVPTPPEGSDDS